MQLTELGQTLMHEHVFVMAPEAFANYGAVWGSRHWDEEERVADAIIELFVREITEGINNTGERPDYLLISREVLPALLDAGVPAQTADQMLVANPRAFFGQ